MKLCKSLFIIAIFAAAAIAQGIQPGPGLPNQTSGGGISVVQSSYSTDDTAKDSPQNLAYGSNVTSGNRLIVLTQHAYMGCPPSVSDTQGNTYTSRGSQPAVNTNRFWWIWDATAGSTGANTVTITYSCSSVYAIAIIEAAGVGGYDTTAGQVTNTNASSPWNASALTTSANGALVIAIGRTDGSASTFSQQTYPVTHSWDATFLILYEQAAAGSITMDAQSTVAAGVMGAVAYIP